MAETLLSLARESNKTPDIVFFEQAVHFLTSDEYKADRSSVCHGLWRALVARAQGGAQFNKLMSDELQEKVLDGILNVHLVSPKANRHLREVLGRILPSESLITRHKQRLTKELGVSSSLFFEHTEEKVQKLLDAQVLQGTKTLTVCMDEFYLVPGMGMRSGEAPIARSALHGVL